jgi:hypothetical protein
MFEGMATAEDGRQPRRPTARSDASGSIPTIVLRKVSVTAQPSTVRWRARAGSGGRREVRVGFCLHEAYPGYELWHERLTTIRVGAAAAKHR